jgi:hypothetical protein
MFSVDLGYKAKDYEEESSITFGAVNQSAYEGDLIETPLVPN